VAANDDIRTAMIELATAVSLDAKGSSDVTRSLADKIDALKVVTAVYVALRKHPGDPADEDDETGFDFSKGVAPEEPTNGVTQIRTRRRPG